MSAGSKATKTSQNFRAQIKTTFEVNGFSEISAEEMQVILSDRTPVSIPVFARNVEIGHDIYGNQWRADFVYARGRVRRVVHARWQQSSGSVDQKFPFFVENAKRLEFKSIFVLGGDGFKKGARAWLSSQKSLKIREVLSEEEFQEWANNGNL
jgi:hypothetical protein